MDAKTNGAALLAAAQGKRGELDSLLETLDERELSAAILHVANVQNTTKRELFAAMVLQARLSNSYWVSHEGAQPIVVASEAVDYADALLEALAEAEGPQSA